MPEKQVNLSVLNELINDIGEGGKEMVSNIITTYLNYTPTIFSNIEQAFQQNDIQTIYRSAHTLKSSSANLGALFLSEISKKLEIQLKPLAETSLSDDQIKQIKDDIQGQVTVLREVFDQVCKELKDFQNQITS